MNNLKNQEYFNDITNYLNHIKNKIELDNSFKLYNTNKFAEYFYAEFLNLLFGYELEIMEKVNPNMVAIDLGDKNGKIAIQVTSQTDREKIKETVKKFNENNLNDDYKRLVVLHIANETPNYNEPHVIEKFDLTKDVWNIKYLLKKMPIDSIDKLKNIRDLLKKYVEESTQILNLSTVLKENYSTNFRTISLLTNTPKQIDKIFINLAIIEEKKKGDGEKKKNNKIYDEVTIQRTVQPIKIEELLEKSKKSFIYGKAGIGKTTLCKYIAYMWSIGKSYQEFEYIIYLPLRRWNKDLGLKGLIRDVYFTPDDELITFDINKNSEKILFLFDGYDELKDRDILYNTINKNSIKNYIITSRPIKCDITIDNKYETIGFTSDNVKEYIDNFFGNSEKSKSLQDFIRNNNRIVEISETPLILEILCILWIKRDDNHTPFTTTSNLYKEIINLILKEHHERNRKDENIYEPKKREKIEDYLGQIAFKGIEKQLFHFDYTFFKEIGIIDREKEESILKNSVLNSGFLLSDRSDNILLDNEFEFIHLTFQEYFSALYVSKLSKEKQKKIIRNYRFYPNFQVFFSFLAGLIDNKQFLLDEIESEPRDFIGWNELNLVLVCLAEIKRENINGVWLEKKNELILKMLTFLKDAGQTEKYNKLINIIYLIDYLDNHSIDLIIDSSEKSSNNKKENLIDKVLVLDIDFYAKMDKLYHQYQEKEDKVFIEYLFDSFFNEQDKSKRDYLYKLLDNDKSYNFLHDYIWEGIFWNRLNQKTFQYLVNFINKDYYNAEVIRYRLDEIPVDCREKKIFEIAVKNLEQSFFNGKFSNLKKEMQCDIVLDIIEYSENHQLKIDACLQLIKNNVASYTYDRNGEVYDKLKFLGIGNQELINALFEAFKNIKIDWRSAVDSADTLSVLDPKNPKLISILFQTLNDKSLNIRARVVSAELLCTLECDRIKLLNKILVFSYEKDIDIKEKIHLLKYMFEHIKIYQEEIFNRLKEILLKEESLDLEVQIDIVHFLIFRPVEYLMLDKKIEMVIFLDKKGQRQIEELIKYVDNKEITLEIRKNIAVALCLLEVTNNLILEYSIESIKNIDEYQKNKLINSIKRISIKDNKNFCNFIEFVKNNDFDKETNRDIKFAIIDIISDNFELFKQASSLLEKYRSIFLGSVSMKVLFKAYDEKYFSLDDVTERVVYIQETVYIKNKRFNTIENSIEISTKRKINIDRLKFLKNDYLKTYENYSSCNINIWTRILCSIAMPIPLIYVAFILYNIYLDFFGRF